MLFFYLFLSIHEDVNFVFLFTLIKINIFKVYWTKYLTSW